MITTINAELPVVLEHSGDLLKITEGIICQQCNCVTVKAHGLSQDIAETFPYANVYAERQSVNSKNAKNNKGAQRNLARASDRSIPGTVRLCCPPVLNTNREQPIVACLFGQFLYGKPGEYKVWDQDGSQLKDDSPPVRLLWFESALTALLATIDTIVATLQPKNLIHIYFPLKIGCGKGGNANHWPYYKQKIHQFATRLQQQHPCLFVVHILTLATTNSTIIPTTRITKRKNKNDSNLNEQTRLKFFKLS